MTGGTRKPGYTIQVVGLNSNVRKTDLQSAFGDYGQIVRIDMVGAKAYLEFDDNRDAKDAIEAWNGKSWKGCSLRVEMKQSGPDPMAQRIARQQKLASQFQVEEFEDSTLSAHPASSWQSRQPEAPPLVAPPQPKPQQKQTTSSALLQTKSTSDKAGMPDRKRSRSRKRRPSSSRSGSASPTQEKAPKKKKKKEANIQKPGKPNIQQPVKGGASTASKDPKAAMAQPKKKKKTQPVEVPPPVQMEAPISSSDPAVYEPVEEEQAVARPKMLMKVNWGDKVQEWIAKKNKEKDDEPPLPPLPMPGDSIFGGAVPPAFDVQQGFAFNEMQNPNPVIYDSYMTEPVQTGPSAVAQQLAEKAEETAKKFESNAVQEMLDRALQAKMATAAAALVAPTTKGAKANGEVAAPEPTILRTQSPVKKPEPILWKKRKTRGRRGCDLRSRSGSGGYDPERARRHSRSDSREGSRPRSDGRGESSRSGSARRPSTKARASLPFEPKGASLPFGAGASLPFEPITAATRVPQAVPGISAFPNVPKAVPPPGPQFGTGAASARAAATPVVGPPGLPVPAQFDMTALMGVSYAGLGLQGGGVIMGHGGAVNVASGEWLCPRCRWRNFPTRKVCVQCKLGRPF